MLEIVKISPASFEQLVIDLLQAMGYGAFDNSGRTTPLSGDEGIDGVIMEDKLGFNLIYIQAKNGMLNQQLEDLKFRVLLVLFPVKVEMVYL